MAISWTYEYYCSRLGVKFEYEDHFICKGPAYTSAYTNSASLGYDFTNDPTEKMFYGYASDASAPNSVGYPILFMHLSGALQYYIKDSSIYQNVSGTQMNYTLTLNPNGGTASSNGSSLTVTIDSQNYNAISSWLPTRSGYNFKGFYNATSGGTQIYTASGAITNDGTYWKNNVWVYKGNVTLYAQWTGKTYTVNFDANGGSTSTSSKSVTHGSTYGTLPTPSRDGHTFNGWYTAKSGGSKITSSSSVSITSTQTLYAQWTANKYTVTFDANGGSASTSSKTVTYGSTYSTLATASRTGYIFGGWYTAKTGGSKIISSSTVSITANQTLYAQWTAITYTIAYNGNGHTGGSTSSSDHIYDEAKALTSNGYSKTGYTFGGWAATPDGGVSYTNGQSVKNLSSTNGATVTLYAVWNIKQSTLIIKPYGGSWNGSTSDSTRKQNYNTSLTLENPIRIGHTFKEWTHSGGGSLVNSTYTFGDSDGTVTASWTINKYTLTVNANGGTWSGTTPVTQNYGTTLNISNPQRDGYTFRGWTINGAGSISGTTFTFGEGNTTLIASWENNSSNIYFYK